MEGINEAREKRQVWIHQNCTRLKKRIDRILAHHRLSVPRRHIAMREPGSHSMLLLLHAPLRSRRRRVMTKMVTSEEGQGWMKRDWTGCRGGREAGRDPSEPNSARLP